MTSLVIDGTRGSGSEANAELPHQTHDYAREHSEGRQDPIHQNPGQFNVEV